MARKDKPPVADFRALIDNFTTAAEFARQCGAKPDAGRVWYRRNRIPKAYRAAVIDQASTVGISISESDFDVLRERGAGVGK